MAEIFLESSNPKTGRKAVFEDNGASSWLYLLVDSGQGIEKDSFVYSPIPPATTFNLSEVEQGAAPILYKEIASSSAYMEIDSESEISFIWSEVNNSVAILIKGEPIAFISDEDQRGYSKSLSKESFFGNPWNQEKYDQLFKKNS